MQSLGNFNEILFVGIFIFMADKCVVIVIVHRRGYGCLEIPYSGYFRGVKHLWFSWLSSEPRNIYPRMIS